MRRLTDVALLERFMTEIGRAAKKPVKFYFTGGATAIDPAAFRRAVEEFVR